jgi:hypothetical protein
MIVLVTGSIAFTVGKTTAVTRSIPVCSELGTDSAAECDEFGGVNALSRAIYAQSAIPFELVSMLLLVAIVVAIAVARGRTADEKKTLLDLEVVKLSPRPFPGDVAGPTLNPGKPTVPTGTVRDEWEPEPDRDPDGSHGE